MPIRHRADIRAAIGMGVRGGAGGGRAGRCPVRLQPTGLTCGESRDSPIRRSCRRDAAGCGKTSVSAVPDPSRRAPGGARLRMRAVISKAYLTLRRPPSRRRLRRLLRTGGPSRRVLIRNAAFSRALPDPGPQFPARGRLAPGKRAVLSFVTNRLVSLQREAANESAVSGYARRLAS